MLTPQLFDTLPRLAEHNDAPSGVNTLLRRLQRASTQHAVCALTPLLDHHWRAANREQQAAIAPLYARALYFELADRVVPLELTHALALAAKDPAAHCIHAKNLTLGDQKAAALAYLREVLSQYAVDADPAFTTLLDELTAQLSYPGWLGMSSEQQLRGRLQADVAPRVSETLVITANDAAVKARRLGKRNFALQCAPPAQQSAPVPVFSVSSVPLLSFSFPPLRIPPLDARVSLDGNTLHGWCTCTRAPTLQPTITVEADGRPLKTIRKLQRLSYSRWGFSVALPAAAKSAAQLNISATIDGVGTFSFPDSPLPTKISALRRRAITQSVGGAVSAMGTVIIPVYNNIADSVRCIRQTISVLPPGWQLIVIDDASTDPAATDALAALAGPAVRLVKNASNLGYAASINVGVDLCDTDVVLLNSDAVVFNGLLEHLRAVASARPEIGTVTAASTDDSIAGIDLPRQDEMTAIGVAARIHQALQSAAPTPPIAVPTGVGHCLYIKRACLQSAGPLDAARFPAGYGEETDFCFKASMQGWTHQIATGAFCFHAGGKSFSQRRTALLERGDAIMKKKYPWYEKTVRATLDDPALARFKRGIREQLLRMGNETFALLITPKLWGGVDRAVSEHCTHLRAQGLTPLVIHPGNNLQQRELLLWHGGLKTNHCTYQCPDELPALIELLAWLNIRAVHIHHAVGIPFELIDWLVENPAYEKHLYVHDYAWACPRINLMGRRGGFCGVPAISECNRCVRAQGSFLSEPIGVAALRQRSAQLFQRVDTVNAVSQDITQRLSRMLGLPASIFKPYALEAPQPPPQRRPQQRRGDRIKVALMGGIGFHKGYSVLLHCLRDAQRRNLPLDFLIIGVSHDNQKLMRYPNLRITGHYKESEAEYLLQRESPDIYFCASIIPESWSYTLTYAIKAGMPIMSFDIGAQAARLKGYPSAQLVPVTASATEINNHFLAHEHWTIG